MLQLVIKRNWLAEVNDRSSHDVPTPTMGGVAIWLLTLSYLVYLAIEGISPGWEIVIACCLVGVVGLWDDLRPLSARLRLGTQTVAAGLIITALLPAEPLVISLLFVVAVVWFTNLFNFMDGIDGIAASQALVFCAGVEVLSGGLTGWSGEVVWVLLGASLAFLAFNWPPAKIFMGDVGSGFLGLAIAMIAIQAWTSEQLPLVACLILLAGFWFDASYTLCVRIVTRQPFTEAHRSHLYQRLASRKGHLWTTNAFLAFALLWLLPIAWLSLKFPAWQLAVLTVALVPLAILCYKFRAGMRS
ncbi:MAG: glycosyl transferase [Pseudomonadales bacterium]|nr:glycosyl transferase [Pseudomonadales bacterium]